MIWIDEARCTGCGGASVVPCVQACPTGALRVVDGVAEVDLDACADCEECLAVCPAHAILAIHEPGEPLRSPLPSRLVASSPGDERRGVMARIATRAAPWVGAALTVVAREVVPRVMGAVLDALERQGKTEAIASEAPAPRAHAAEVDPRSGGGGGHRRRHGR